AHERDVAGGRLRMAAGSFVAGALGVLATYTLLYVFVPLWIVKGWLLVTDRGGGRRFAPHALVGGLSAFIAGEALVATRVPAYQVQCVPPMPSSSQEHFYARRVWLAGLLIAGLTPSVATAQTTARMLVD